MIGPHFVQTMARYGAWQNESLASAADGLSDEERTAARGAFFGSIAATLNHLLWGDRLWLSRFAAEPKPPGGIPESVALTPDWSAYRAARRATDEATLAWAARVSAVDLEGDLVWYSGALGREVSKPRALLVVHFFNHQTHHRGQVHAMLTAAGARPEATDLFAMRDA